MPLPVARTALDIVKLIRFHAQIMDTGTYRNGFSTDPDTGATLIPLLSFANQALTLMSRTGLIQAYFSIPTSIAGYEYDLPTAAGRVVTVTYAATSVGTGPLRALREKTLHELDAQNRDWRNTPGTPNVFALAGSTISVYPVPTTAGYLRVKAHTCESALVNPTDTPLILPIPYHDSVGHLGAMLLCSSDADTSGRAARLDTLLGLWEATNADIDALVQARSLLKSGTLPLSRPEGGSRD